MKQDEISSIFIEISKTYKTMTSGLILLVVILISTLVVISVLAQGNGKKELIGKVSSKNGLMQQKNETVSRSQGNQELAGCSRDC